MLFRSTASLQAAGAAVVTAGTTAVDAAPSSVIQFAELPGNTLTPTQGSTITLDRNAAPGTQKQDQASSLTIVNHASDHVFANNDSKDAKMAETIGGGIQWTPEMNLLFAGIGER